MNKNSFGFTYWFIIILASSVIIFTGFLLLNRPPQTPTSFKQEVPANLPRNDDLRGWETFNSQIIPIEFKTPPDWVVEEERIIGAYDNLMVTARSPDFIQKNYLLFRGFQITFNILNLNLTLNKKPVKFDSYERFNELGGFVTEERFKNIYGGEKIVTINGISWLKYPASAYTLYGKNTLSARITSTEEQQSVAETLFDQILSTFKFTN